MELYKYVRDLKDDILINNRVDKGRTGMKGMTVSTEFAGDFGTPEQEVGAFLPDVPWESCITICQQWAWKPNDKMKSRRECLQTLARTVGGGGNLLLNVGPMLDGRIEQRQAERLREVGSWLEKYGESIYETRGGPFAPSEQFVSTYKDNKIYLHVFEWPADTFTLPELKNNAIKSVGVLKGAALIYSSKNDKISIQLSGQLVDKDDTVIVIELEKNVRAARP
jgi:alpha-L-fucosidase